MFTQRLVTAVGGAAVLAVVGFGCGGSDNSSDAGGDNPLVGTWRVTTLNMNGVDVAPETIMTLVFNADGTAYQSEVDGGVTDAGAGTWTAAGGQVTVSWEATATDPAEVETMPYTVNGNTLTVTITGVDGDTGQPMTVTGTLTRM